MREKLMDEKLITEFYFLIEPLQQGEVYLFIGGARKKYAKNNEALSTSAEVVTRSLLKTDYKLDLIDILKKLRLKISLSRDKNTNRLFPSESITLWFNPNPRNTVKAWFNLQSRMNLQVEGLLYAKVGNEHQYYKQFSKIDSLFHSEIHKTPSRRLYSMIDVDTKDMDVLIPLIKSLHEHIAWVSETRGGYHIIYKVKGNEIVYKEKMKFNDKYRDVEFKYDSVTYVWGTIQGGFMVKPFDWRSVL